MSELAKDWKKCSRLLAAMRRLGIEPDVATCNSVIRALGLAGQHGLAFASLREMWELGPAPDLSTYSDVLVACRATDEKDGALHALDEAVRRGLRPDSRHFNLAIGACRGGHWSAARELLRVMRGEAVEPDGASYGLAVAACSRALEADVAFEILESRRDAGLAQDGDAIDATARACDAGGRWVRALRLLREAREGRIQLGLFAGSSIVSSFLKKGKWEQAHMLAREPRTEGTVLIGRQALSALMTSYRGAQRWEEAASVLRELQNSSAPLPSLFQRPRWRR